MPRMTTALLCSPPFCLSALRNWFIDTSKTAFLPVWTLTSMLLRTNKSTDDGIYILPFTQSSHTLRLRTATSDCLIFYFNSAFKISSPINTVELDYHTPQLIIGFSHKQTPDGKKHELAWLMHGPGKEGSAVGD